MITRKDLDGIRIQHNLVNDLLASPRNGSHGAHYKAAVAAHHHRELLLNELERLLSQMPQTPGA
ncbi:MAG: hypothetical protein OEW11_00585 [Nitrospirota bacterium]|nr:hypothetical protein [Nitrospirota bacterium]